MNRVRCAIYTRKSSEEGLEQDFNSLHAQREACAAYVMSQAGEGWSLIDTPYDDGGISGGTLERPALQRLLADIAEKKIDIVVVYKVDRLTRSLLDFSKLVEAFDAAGTSFVSVTQSFNTTTSMGRLTLNMLLSFAQFEREVTAERIRDKIAASKAKGMWMGGVPPLGYKPDGRTLAIVESEATLVRDIFRRYLETGNVRLVAEALTSERIKSPIRSRRNGATFGGCSFTRGQIHYMLTSPVYTGRIGHKGKLYEGQHPAIIDIETWDHVQTKLAEHVLGVRTTRQPNRSLLAGKIVDHTGEPLIAVHACKAKVRYRYYVSRGLHTGMGISGDGIRVPAREIETLVGQHVASLFDDAIEAVARCWLDVPPDRYEAITGQCGVVAAMLRAGGSGSPLSTLLKQIRISSDRIQIDIYTSAVAAALQASLAEGAAEQITVECETRVQRTGLRVKLVHKTGAASIQADPDRSLIALVQQAHRWWSVLSEGQIKIKAFAKHEGVTPSWMTRVVRLAFLAPSVTEALLNGQQRAGLGTVELLAAGAFATMWGEQEQKYLAS